MTHHKNLTRILVLGTSLATLSACGFYSSAMPSGYTYHHNEYKSPAAKSPASITVEQRKYMDATQAEQFRSAVYDLLERLTMRAGMAPKPVYISTPDPMTTFYANLDNDLRESMRHIGYALSDKPEGAYVFTYEAQALTDAQGKPALQNGNNVMIAVRVFDSYNESARQLTEETGQYFIQGAELLKMGPANQKFLKPTGKKTFNKPMTQRRVAPVPMEVTQPLAPRPVAVIPDVIVTPVMAPIGEVKAIPAPRAPVAPVEASMLKVAPMIDVDAQAAPTNISRNAIAGRVSQSIPSYTDRKASRNAIKVINRDVKSDVIVTPRPDVTTQPIKTTSELPSLEAIEAEIQKLDAEIAKTTAEMNNVKTNMAKDVVKGRISKPVQ